MSDVYLGVIAFAVLVMASIQIAIIIEVVWIGELILSVRGCNRLTPEHRLWIDHNTHIITGTDEREGGTTLGEVW